MTVCLRGVLTITHAYDGIDNRPRRHTVLVLAPLVTPYEEIAASLRCLMNSFVLLPDFRLLIG
jgi:hypothetical protein